MITEEYMNRSKQELTWDGKPWTKIIEEFEELPASTQNHLKQEKHMSFRGWDREFILWLEEILGWGLYMLILDSLQINGLLNSPEHICWGLWTSTQCKTKNWILRFAFPSIYRMSFYLDIWCENIRYGSILHNIMYILKKNFLANEKSNICNFPRI